MYVRAWFRNMGLHWNMELRSFRGRTIKRMTTHQDPKTNVIKAVVLEFEEGDQLMFAVLSRGRNEKLDISFAPTGIELTWPPS